MSQPFHGIIPALPTPFSQGECDYLSFERHLNYLQKAGVHGVVVCGSTGEGATVTEEEFTQLIQLARKSLPKSIPVIAGTGTNATASTIERSKLALKSGADAVLIVTPYYNKPPQEGLVQHYQTIAATMSAPIILYNVPSRTACNILPETVARLAPIKNIVAIKEASGSLNQAAELVARCRSNPATREFAVLSGEDSLFLPMLTIGCTGIITVVGNLAAKEMVRLYEVWQKGESKSAESLHYKLRELTEQLFIETNPIPLKAALHQMGIYRSSELRLPLIKMSEKYHDRMRALLTDLNLLNQGSL